MFQMILCFILPKLLLQIFDLLIAGLAVNLQVHFPPTYSRFFVLAIDASINFKGLRKIQCLPKAAIFKNSIGQTQRIRKRNLQCCISVEGK